jgi:hypothetical protein
MLALPRSGPILLGCLLFAAILTYSWPLSSPVFARRQLEMESLSQPFTMQINGRPIAPVDPNADNVVQAQLGSEAATFELKNGRLISGDWVLGRNLTEDRSMGPKKVSWFKDGTEPATRLHPVTAYEEGGDHKLKFGGGSLVAEDGSVFVDLFGGKHPPTLVLFFADGPKGRKLLLLCNYNSRTRIAFNHRGFIKCSFLGAASSWPCLHFTMQTTVVAVCNALVFIVFLLSASDTPRMKSKFVNRPSRIFMLNRGKKVYTVISIPKALHASVSPVISHPRL